ncbi:probable cadmium/zinc-transporting ATPase HMA1, chloroplastic isoform X3 [Typha latifolia]|uniref:probable cadmium/zinc-transporting ATPase HMA1, chloroplastic isoform X3 n=1 Tax=Typha latifolia TaxID=4733 RepID=UPI003C301F24
MMENLAMAAASRGTACLQFSVSAKLRPTPFPPFLDRRCDRSDPLRSCLQLTKSPLCPPFRPPWLPPRRSMTCRAHDHHHRHYDHHHHEHHHSHGHSHAHGEDREPITRAQKAIILFAKAVGWADLADILREHLQLCCCSMALLLLAATCPYAVPSRAVKPLQSTLITVAFPLVGAVPVDGEVFQGSSTVTIEHLTGETKPLERKVGDTIPGGARNLEGMMIIKVTKSWEHSTLNKIVQLAEEGQLNKPKLQRWLDEFGEYYGRAVVAISLVIALLGPFLFKWPFIGNSVSRGSVYRALGLMVAASPCALAVAPLAYATAISACANKGVLLKGGNVLDALAACQSIAFDKTGTLTTGKLMCKAIEPIHGHSEMESRSEDASCCVPNCEREALAVAAAMEKGTTHPIGRAVLDHTLGKVLPEVAVESFECLPGRGLVATLARKPGNGDNEPLNASLGSVEYIVSLCKSNDDSERIKNAVKASAYGPNFIQAALCVNRKVTLFHFEDEPRPCIAEVISILRDKAKLHIMMLTGDHESSAWRVAKAVGINEVHCSLKPEDKLNQVKTASRDTGRGLIMVGDGINDAPALAASTVGIVLAQRASATAIAVADVLLLQDNISAVPFCIAKARQTTTLVKQSVALALSCILFAALSSVLGCVPLWLTVCFQLYYYLLEMILYVLLHEGGTLLVCLNSIRALNDPTWSWVQDLQQLLNGLRKIVVGFFWRPASDHTAQAVPM